MEQYKKVRLYSLSEMRSLFAVDGEKPVELEWPEYRVGNDLYLDLRTSFSQLTDSITIPGAFDFAVPQSWFNEVRPEGLNRAVWWYPPLGEEGHLLGKPLTLREMIQMLKKEYGEAKKTNIINSLEMILELAEANFCDPEDNEEETNRQIDAYRTLKEYVLKTLG
jgi:hypothetical protein